MTAMMRPSIARAPTATPTPMPAFAPTEKPPDAGGVVVVDDDAACEVMDGELVTRVLISVVEVEAVVGPGVVVTAGVKGSSTGPGKSEGVQSVSKEYSVRGSLQLTAPVTPLAQHDQTPRFC